LIHNRFRVTARAFSPPSLKYNQQATDENEEFSRMPPMHGAGRITALYVLPPERLEGCEGVVGRVSRHAPPAALFFQHAAYARWQQNSRRVSARK